MHKRNQVYKCEVCGNIVEMLHPSFGNLVCCNEPMELQKEKNNDEKKEKHVPVLKEGQEGSKVVVGSTPHPMTEEHYIEWVEIINGDYVNRKHLNPGDQPEAEFYVEKQPNLVVRAYCNKHGHWSA